MSTDRWVTSSAVAVHGDAQDIYGHVPSLTCCFTVLVQKLSDTKYIFYQKLTVQVTHELSLDPKKCMGKGTE